MAMLTDVPLSETNTTVELQLLSQFNSCILIKEWISEMQNSIIHSKWYYYNIPCNCISDELFTETKIDWQKFQNDL